jgi:hypothetical protein
LWKPYARNTPRTRKGSLSVFSGQGAYEIAAHLEASGRLGGLVDAVQELTSLERELDRVEQALQLFVQGLCSRWQECKGPESLIGYLLMRSVGRWICGKDRDVCLGCSSWRF